MASEGKKARGRQRIEMKRIEKEDDLIVSFSKRRSGISKKASDMVTLCGGEVAIVIFSPSEALKERRKSLEKISKTRGSNQEFWWNASLDELDVNELKQTYASMAELHMTITNHLKERRNAFGASSSSARQTNPNFDTNPSGFGSYAFPPGYGH